MLSDDPVVIACVGAGDEMPAPWIEPLSNCLAGSEPHRVEDFRRFWADWAEDRIPGRKVTVAAWEGGPPPPCAQSQKAVGVVRFWESPYCGNKWFVEGLEVIESHRRRGIATKMLETAIPVLRRMGIGALYAHVRDTNAASIRTVLKVGFTKIEDGRYVSTYGESIVGGSEYRLDLTGSAWHLTIR